MIGMERETEKEDKIYDRGCIGNNEEERMMYFLKEKRKQGTKVKSKSKEIG